MKPGSYPPGTRVALYLRRSTDEHQEESLETQRTGAQEYCAARGWVIVEVFIDDGLSRAEFKKREGLWRMLNHAKAKAFQLVVLRDESRLGGDMARTTLVMQDLADAGVGIVYYISDELVAVDSAMDQFAVVMRNFISQMEREKISSRTREHLMQKAKAGKPAGGISYGYVIENKQYVVKAPEAAIVRRIFSEYAAGLGLRTIAHQLNDEHVASPRAGARGTGSWAPSAIRSMLLNTRYIGQGRYNQTRKLYKGGTKIREQRAATEHFTYECPAIVDRATWDAVAQRFGQNVAFGSRAGTAGASPRYLLTGISRCAECSGPITVGRRKFGQVNTSVYMCGWRKNRGLSVCRNMKVGRVDDIDDRVIQRVLKFLEPQFIKGLVARVREGYAARQAEAPGDADRLRREVEKLRREVERLTTAIATMDEPPGALLQAVADRDKRLRQAELELSRVAASTEAIDDVLETLDSEALRAIQGLRQELQQSQTARATLIALLGTAKLMFEPTERGYRVAGTVAAASLLRPAATAADCVASPAGFDTVGSLDSVLEPVELAWVA